MRTNLGRSLRYISQMRCIRRTDPLALNARAIGLYSYREDELARRASHEADWREPRVEPRLAQCSVVEHACDPWRTDPFATFQAGRARISQRADRPIKKLRSIGVEGQRGQLNMRSTIHADLETQLLRIDCALCARTLIYVRWGDLTSSQSAQDYGLQADFGAVIIILIIMRRANRAVGARFVRERSAPYIGSPAIGMSPGISNRSN